MPKCLDCGENEDGMHGLCPECAAEWKNRVLRSIQEEDDSGGQSSLADF